jgi:hypothetical protein
MRQFLALTALLLVTTVCQAQSQEQTDAFYKLGQLPDINNFASSAILQAQADYYVTDNYYSVVSGAASTVTNWYGMYDSYSTCLSSYTAHQNDSRNSRNEATDARDLGYDFELQAIDLYNKGKYTDCLAKCQDAMDKYGEALCLANNADAYTTTAYSNLDDGYNIVLWCLAYGGAP